MERENKARRPRIGENKGIAAREGNTERYEKVEYSKREDTHYDPDRRPRVNYNNDRNYNRPSYGNNDDQRRPYNRQQGGYNNNRGNYGNQGGDHNYNNNYNRPQRQYNNPRPYGNDQEGYNANRPYRPQTGGQRPYNNRGNNGYQQRGGYDNNRGYNNNYNNNRGGYNNRNNNGGRPFNRPQRRENFVPNKRIIYEELNVDPNQPIRLNKYMANAGVCSRREADEFIQAGQVKVNGVVMSELGTKITRNDVVTFQDKVITPEHKIYVLLNKPKDCVTTSDDPQGRLTVMDIVRNACTERIYPVGRLDRNTTGVLLLTNDGDLASKLTHPKFIKKKIYHVWTDKDVSEEDMQRIADGIELEDGPIHADAVSYATDTDKNQVGIEIHSGRNRIVRRMFEALGYRVIKLDRVYFAGLTKKNLQRGRWRYLTQQEVNMLQMGSFE